MDKETNRKKYPIPVKDKKTFLIPILTLLLWLSLIAVIFYINPESPGAIPLFFSLVFFSLFLSFFLLINNLRRSLFLSVGCVFFLFLKYLGIGSLLNLLLIIGVLTSLEFYFSQRKNLS